MTFSLAQKNIYITVTHIVLLCKPFNSNDICGRLKNKRNDSGLKNWYLSVPMPNDDRIDDHGMKQQLQHKLIVIY